MDKLALFHKFTAYDKRELTKTEIVEKINEIIDYLNEKEKETRNSKRKSRHRL